MLKEEAMYEMFECSIRGGMKTTVRHEAHQDLSDPQNQKHILYIEENILYGDCMRQKLPSRNSSGWTLRH